MLLGCPGETTGCVQHADLAGGVGVHRPARKTQAGDAWSDYGSHPMTGDVMLVSVALVHRPAAHRREGNSLVKGCVCLAVSHGRDMDQYLQALWDGQNTERCGR